MTERKTTVRARRRQRAKDVQEAIALPQEAFVQQPLAAVLASAQRIVATELAYIAAGQQAGTPMEPGEAKKLQALMASLQASVTMEAKLNEGELGDLSDEEMDRMLVAELAKRQLPKGEQ